MINTQLEVGNYKVMIDSKWDTKKFEGEKHIILLQTNALGGKNYFLGYMYIAVGVLSLICAIIFIIRKIQRPKGLLKDALNKNN